jgi:hypothetical protein
MNMLPREDEHEVDEPDYIPDGDINPRASESDDEDEPNYIGNDELNPRIDELTGKVKIMSFSDNDEDGDVDPYLQLINENEDPDPYHKIESDPYLTLNADADEPASYVEVDEKEECGSYLTIEKGDSKPPAFPTSSRRYDGHLGKQAYRKPTQCPTVQTDQMSPKHSRNPLVRLLMEQEPIPPQVPERGPPPLPRRDEKPSFTVPYQRTTQESVPPPLPSRVNTMPNREAFGTSSYAPLMHSSSVPSRPPPLPVRRESEPPPLPTRSPSLPARNLAGFPPQPNRTPPNNTPPLPHRQHASSDSVEEIFYPTGTESSGRNMIPPPLPARTGPGGTPPTGSPQCRRPPLPFRRDSPDCPSPKGSSQPVVFPLGNLPPPLPDRSSATRQQPLRPPIQKQESFDTGPDYFTIDSDKEFNNYVEV